MIIRMVDEVNCLLDGFDPKVIAHLRAKIKYKERDAFMTAAFKMGMWDGYTSLIEEDGVTFNYLIPMIVDELSKVTTLCDINDVDLIDNRLPTKLPEQFPVVTADYLMDEMGKTLRDIQVDAINAALSNRKGILNLATNAGKTFICLAISKMLDPYVKTIIIVPSAQLAKQTYDDYRMSNLATAYVSSSVKPEKRQQMVESHRHIIMTTKLFQNCLGWLKAEDYAIIGDEIHIFGDVQYDAFRFDFAQAQIRLGLTGTVPKDQLKAERIKCCLGGDVISTVAVSSLISRGFAAIPTITMVQTSHPYVEDMFSEMGRGYDWSVEQRYLHSNRERAEAIVSFISNLSPTNTLVLVHAAFGTILSELMDIPLIYDGVDVSERAEMFGKFTTSNDHIQLASFGTSSTGISQNRIFRLILIDVGKDAITTMQSIGRGIRLDGVVNKVDVIDISSNMKYGIKHRKERQKLYNTENLPFIEADYSIEI